MKLYILRHGDAGEPGETQFKDTERALTPKGIQRTKQLAHALREMEISFAVIMSSPLTRARQTAEIIARGTEKKVDLTDALTLSGDMEKLVAQITMIRPVPESVLLVGHEPYLSGFISLLCVGGPELPVKMKKGALCRLEIENLICGKCATLEWLLQPRLVGLKPSKRDEG
jgi:phosphohistidine phosphatase